MSCLFLEKNMAAFNKKAIWTRKGCENNNNNNNNNNKKKKKKNKNKNKKKKNKKNKNNKNKRKKKNWNEKKHIVSCARKTPEFEICWEDMLCLFLLLQ